MGRIKAKDELYSDKSHNPVTSTEYIKHGDKWLNEVIDGNISGEWIIESSHEPYAFDAECIGSSFYPQGMCKCVYNNHECIAQAYITVDNSQQKIVIMDVYTGTKYKTKIFTMLGHANSLTWDGTNIYVATGGGDASVANIVKLDVDLNVVSTHPIEVWAVAYANGKIFALGSSSSLLVIDATTMTVSGTISTNIGFRGYTVYQGLASDGNYLYVPNSMWYSASTDKNKDRFGEFIDVYTFNGELVHTIKVNITFETEEIDFFNGFVLAVANTGGTSNYMKVGIYAEDEGKYRSYGYREYGLLGVSIANETFKAYVNENYTGWLMDGSQEHPYYNIWVASRYVPISVKTFKIELLSDISTEFRIHTVYHKGFTVDITGNNHKTIKDIYAEGMYNLTVRDFEFVGTGSVATDAALYIKSINYVWLNNVTFSGDFGGKRCLYSIATNLTINKITYQNVSNYGSAVLDVTEGGSVTLNTVVMDRDDYTVSIRVSEAKLPSINANNKAVIYTGNWDVPNISQSFYCGVDIDLARIRKACMIRVPQSINVLNAPTSANGKPSLIDFKWLTNTIALISLTYYYGNYNEIWDGYLDTVTSEIDWKCEATNKSTIGENILNYPYYSQSDTTPNKGITRTINPDGTITFDGVSTGNTTNFFCMYNGQLPAGTYTLSGCPNVNGLQIRFKYNDNTLDLNAGTESITFVIDEYVDDVQIYPRVTKAGVVCDNVVFRPMLERNKIPHDYQPYALSRAVLRRDIDALSALI